MNVLSFLLSALGGLSIITFQFETLKISLLHIPGWQIGVNSLKGQNLIRNDETCRELTSKWPSLYRSSRDMLPSTGWLSALGLSVSINNQVMGSITCFFTGLETPIHYFPHPISPPSVGPR